MTRHFDLIAVGGGSGGIAASIRAARHGARCALISGSRLGGTCVNRGCIPKKIMWHAAGVSAALHDAADYGFNLAPGRMDWERLKLARDNHIERLVGIYRENLAAAGVELIEGYASFSGPRILTVGGRSYSAEHTVLATGGRPIVPSVPGAGLGITSDGFFELAAQPRRVAIVGSGYIAVEFAGILNAIGSDVTVLLRGRSILTHFDITVREVLLEEMQKAGIGVLTGIHVQGLERDANGALTVICGDDQRLAGFDTVIWAIGRSGNIEQLNLEAAGLEPDHLNGIIATDAFQRTPAPGVYAIGDVTGRIGLTPVAIAAGRRLADRLFGADPQARLDYNTIPTVVFSHPPVATVGLTEGEARDRYGDAVRVYQKRFTPLYHAVTTRKVRSAVKLITVGADEKIIGCHIVGPGAEEMLQGFAVAIRMGATKKDFDATVAIHPSGAEELLNMR